MKNILFVLKARNSKGILTPSTFADKDQPEISWGINAYVSTIPPILGHLCAKRCVKRSWETAWKRDGKRRVKTLTPTWRSHNSLLFFFCLPCLSTIARRGSSRIGIAALSVAFVDALSPRTRKRNPSIIKISPTRLPVFPSILRWILIAIRSLIFIARGTDKRFREGPEKGLFD